MNARKWSAEEAYRKAIVINSCDSTYALKPNYCFTDEYLNEMLTAGVTCAIATVAYAPSHDFRFTVNFIANTYGYKYRDSKLKLALRAEDLKKAKREGKVLLMIGTQNASPIEHDIGLLPILYDLGLRAMGLTYNHRNLLGDGCLEKANSGLSAFGAQVIEEMNKLGILIDLSHVGERTSLEAMDVSKDPVIFSHSAAIGLRNHWRNMTDEQIKACADSGGVIGIPSFPLILKDGQATMKDYLDHFDYIAKLVGVGHVGIGLDIPGGRNVPEEIKSLTPDLNREEASRPPVKPIVEDNSEFPNVPRALSERGYSDQDIEKIVGGNFMRVFERILK